jgi:short-subunit dehydrogenase
MIKKVHDTFGQIDVLVNNAGQALRGSVDSLNLDSFRQVIDLNVFGVLYAMQTVVPLMKTNGGLILNISSMVSKMAIQGIGGYASTKYMLNGLTLTAREELAKDNIRVILVYPRLTATNFGQNSIGYQGSGAARPAGIPVREGVPIDSATHVAEKILEAIKNEPAEQFME